MTTSYPTNMAAFQSSSEAFEDLVGRLGGEEAADLDHGSIEELLKRDGFDLLRRLFQDHLDLRSCREKREEAVEGADGMERAHVRSRRRQLETIFGTVWVHRLSYSAPEHPSVHPLDAALNLPVERHSEGLRRMAAEEASRSSFDEAVSAIERNTSGKVAKRQAEGLVATAAQDFDRFYEERCDQEEKLDDFPLVISVDGKGIVMRKEDLTASTRKAAEKGTPKLDKRRCKGEKAGRKRMATVAAVYSIEGRARGVDDIMGELRSVKGDKHKRGGDRPRAQNKRVWASIESSSKKVTEDAFREGQSRDPQRRRHWAVLVDGDPHQLERVKACAKKFDVTVTIVVDFIHVLEYLWKAAYCFHPEGSQEAQDWVTERARRLLEGTSSQVAAGMRRSATKRGISKKERMAVDKCADYLLKRREYLRYDEYLAAGLPIASGVIEGACRHLVKDRMDITGARWSLRGAEAVLRLRALRSSGDFDTYFAFHREAERRRNHEERYAERQWNRLARAA